MKNMMERLVVALLLSLVGTVSAAPTKIELLGDWTIGVVTEKASAVFEIAPPEIVAVSDEKLAELPLYNPKGPMYRRGATVKGVKAQECSVKGAIDLNSVVVRDKPGDEGKVYQYGVDYTADAWGNFGRLETGTIREKQPVYISYRYAKMRLDSIVLPAGGGKPELRPGEAHVSIPALPELKPGEKRLANIWIAGPVAGLSGEAVFPVLAEKYPLPQKTGFSVAEKLLPRTLQKLRAGEKVHLLAWGDSVTDAGYLPSKEERWQEQFAARLRKAFPKAEITLTTEAWGGRNSGAYLAEPPGSPKNYKEKILDIQPDLVVMEFVNDAGLNEKTIFERYGRLLDDFRAIGAEWIILTPHYTRLDMMRFTSCRDTDEDPRPYVSFVRKFAEQKNVAVAEGSKRYGHLWREGIPYMVLLMNNINHPNGFGMGLFAEALMELFPAGPDS